MENTMRWKCASSVVRKGKEAREEREEKRERVSTRSTAIKACTLLWSRLGLFTDAKRKKEKAPFHFLRGWEEEINKK
jgi:hypothetical protein